VANPARKFKSDAFEAIHSAVSDLREARMITAATLREYDQLCMTPPPLSALQIRALRRQLKVSQPVFAAFLNTTASTIVQWESGKKRPSGMGRKLLQIAKAKGLQGLTVG
jgi:putative transcriptional regulator